MSEVGRRVLKVAIGVNGFAMYGSLEFGAVDGDF